MEQEVPGNPENNKPDLVIISPDNQKVTIIDVMVPFQGEEESLSEVRAAKKTSTPLSNCVWMLSEKGYQEVKIDAFIVGSQRSWDQANEEVNK